VRYKNIVFDMGGVLLDFSEARHIEHFFGGLKPEEQAQVRWALMGSGLWRRYDRGDFDDDGMVREVCALLPPHLHPYIADMVPHNFEAMPPLPTGELIPQLKARGQGVYLLSNTPHAFHREKLRIPHIDRFDGILASCDVGLLKPDPEIFRLFLRTFGLRAEDCLFIDDMQANIEGAAEAGIAGHCFADGDLERLRAALEL